ncbi:hypothetical protein, partial [uncultured Dialister sp.]|uniref:hypothetical protein n=1 Tax=uncultured Dialister sp. TaxID=278064 RepID=UPI0026774C12
ESAFIRIFMHCFVMGLLKQLAICVVPFLALHKNSRIKADNDLISASLDKEGAVKKCKSFFTAP